ncbi:MAG: hypothetical protein JO142_10725 [Burkholderiales bacterium]|nr:hypothetical protein [Burkholderiales bacterium]
MFGLGKKDPFATVVCKAKKLDGQAAQALKQDAVDLVAMIKAADASELCSKISFGRIYQKPGTLLSEHNASEQGYSASYDKVTKSIGVGLRQGLMRQTLVLVTKEPTQLAVEIGLTLDLPTPSEPTVS